MIEKTVVKKDFDHYSSVHEDLAYWLSRTPEERLAAVDYLRQHYYGSSARLQRIARVIER